MGQAVPAGRRRVRGGNSSRAASLKLAGHPLAILRRWATLPPLASRPSGRQPLRGGVSSVMKFLVSRRTAGAVLVAVAAGAVAAAAYAGGSADTPGNGPETATLVKSRSSFRGDVRTLPQLPPQAQRERPQREEPQTPLQPSGEAAPIGSGSAPASISAPAPSATSFDGLHYAEDCNGSQCGRGHPPDTNGDVGPTYYIQTINVALGIYDKSNGSRVAAFTFDQLMSQA